MSMSSSHTAEFLPELTSCKRRAVRLVGLSCLIFVWVTVLYCYFYALSLGGNLQSSFWDTIRCVSIDWLGWAIIAPFLTHVAVKEDVSTQSGVIAVVKWLVIATLALGVARMSMEYALSGEALVHTLAYFVPRYLFVTAFFIGGGVFYVFKHSAALEIQRLKQQNRSSMDTEVGNSERCQHFVVYKGNCRALVQCEDIISITASGNYLEFATAQGSYLMRNTMKTIESQLDCRQFARIHRSHIVNLAQLDSVSRTRLEANLANGDVLRVGKKYLSSLPHFA